MVRKYRGRKRRRFRKRYTTKWRRIIPARQNFSIPLGLPDKFLTKMRYNTQVTMNPTTGALVAVSFRANDLYDPEVPSGGRQPTPFDQMCFFYKRFRVLSTKMVVTPIYGEASANNCGAFGICVQKTVGDTALMTVNDVMQGEKNTSKISQPGNMNYVGYAGNRIQKIYWSGKKFFGSSYKSDADYTCSALTYPTTQAYLEVWYADITGATDPASQKFNVFLEYVVLCDTPNSITSS